ncbi:unnamed protein product, partial [Ilex paraguariensis]
MAPDVKRASRARLFKEYKEVQREKVADPDIQLVCDDSNIFKWTALIKSPTRRVDPLLNSYSDYEDSVYGDCCNLDFLFTLTELWLTAILIAGLAWSSREPWIFASLSYDGR